MPQSAVFLYEALYLQKNVNAFWGIIIFTAIQWNPLHNKNGVNILVCSYEALFIKMLFILPVITEYVRNDLEQV